MPPKPDQRAEVAAHRERTRKKLERNRVRLPYCYAEAEVRTAARMARQVHAHNGWRPHLFDHEVLGLKHYGLNEAGEIVEMSLEAWARWFEKADRRIAEDWLGGIRISTVFLGIDHNHGALGREEPILYETMIFWGDAEGVEGELGEYQERACSREEALANHARAIEVATQIVPAVAFEREALKTRARVQRARKEKR